MYSASEEICQWDELGQTGICLKTFYFHWQESQKNYNTDKLGAWNEKPVSNVFIFSVYPRWHVQNFQYYEKQNLTR